jgi:hypothetical protein
VRSEAGRGLWVVMLFVSLVLLGERTGSRLAASLGMVSNMRLNSFEGQRPTHSAAEPTLYPAPTSWWCDTSSDANAVGLVV